MEGKTILVFVLLTTLGIAVAVAGFMAEATRAKRYELIMHINYAYKPFCHYPSSPAVALALAAALALVLARTIITTATGGCCSSCQGTPHVPICARVCIIISWITSSIAVFLFIAGVILSNQNAKGDIYNGYYCYIIRPGVFSAAAIMGLLSVLLGLVYYFLYVLARRRVAEKSEVNLELEKPPVTDVKISPAITDAEKPTISDGEPQVSSPKH